MSDNISIIEFNDTPFRIEVETIKDNWGKVIVHIFQDNTKIGEYTRNYRFLNTFYPFQIDNEWYALYSKDYTATRVMKLPSCEDWCGEESAEGGFCPVEYYVPFSMVYSFPSGRGYDVSWVQFDNEKSTVDPEDSKCLVKDSKRYCDFGFVSGCVWGDDSSWKIQYLDFSNIKDRKMTRSERFGYLELPDGYSLKDCVKLSDEYMKDRSIYGVDVISKKFFGLRDKIEDEYEVIAKSMCGEK